MKQYLDLWQGICISGCPGHHLSPTTSRHIEGSNGGCITHPSQLLLAFPLLVLLAEVILPMKNHTFLVHKVSSSSTSFIPQFFQEPSDTSVCTLKRFLCIETKIIHRNSQEAPFQQENLNFGALLLFLSSFGSLKQISEP